MAVVNLITLPQDVLDRVERVLEYHESTKLTRELTKVYLHHVDRDNQPYEFRMFEMLPRATLPTNLLDLSVPTLSLMEDGPASLPESHVTPPQDLKSLATWLHFANGIAQKRRTVTATQYTRTVASDGNAFPCELYVAAFAIDGLEPGLYHYSPREFALRRLREGAEALSRFTRGRPDLAFLKTVPAAFLVSTIFCRSTWRFGKRGYRHALHDAGYFLQNLVTVGQGLGVQTITRLFLNDSATRDLIGISPDADFGEAESVQAMVVWADRAVAPIAKPQAAAGATAATPSGPMPPVDRPLLANDVTSYVSILSTHQDCVAPGVAVREVRPPLTDMSPLPPNLPVFETPPSEAKPPGEPLRKILLTRQAATEFSSRAIARDQFMQINRLAFRGGTFFPLHPDGPHVALARPFWVIHDVTGMDPGVWFYHPPTDQWAMLSHGHFRRESALLAMEQPAFGNCAATCFLVCNLRHLMSVAGPDIYRLAHLEAGVITNRLALSSEALNLGWCQTASFYDDECRQFLGLRTTGWEMISIVALGTRLGGVARAADDRPGVVSAE